MGFKKYSTSPFTLVEEDNQPDWVKKAQEEKERLEKEASEVEKEDDSE